MAFKFARVLILGGLLLGFALPTPSARACDAESQTTFGVIPGCFDQRISDVPTVGNLSPDFTQAGGHPYEFEVRLNVNSPAADDPVNGVHWPPEPLRSVTLRLPRGLIANPTVVASCTMEQLQYGDPGNGSFEVLENAPLCPPASQVGVTAVDLTVFEEVLSLSEIPLYYMGSPPGTLARLGFSVLGIPTVADAELGADHELILKIRSLNQGIAFDGAAVTLWGAPADPLHTPQRSCPGEPSPAFSENPQTCPAGLPVRSFLRLPTVCGSAPTTSLQVDSWLHPGKYGEVSVINHLAPGLFGDPTDAANYPAEYPGVGLSSWGPPQGFTGCQEIPFSPELLVRTTKSEVEQPTGLDIEVTFPQPGVTEQEAISESDLRSAKISLPSELELNPAVANGLTACSSDEAGLGSNRNESDCPDSSKLGKFEVHSPLQGAPVLGWIFLGQQEAGAGNIVLPVYLIAEGDALSLKLSADVVLDEQTGDLIAVIDDGPQLPIDWMRLRFFDGERAPFITPASCGVHESRARFAAWSGSPSIDSAARFQIQSGPLGSKCPAGDDAAGFSPGFSAGVSNPVAAADTSLIMRLTRRDGEQEMSSVDLSLPPGLSASLRGVERCPDAVLAHLASGTRSGFAELQVRSCPRGAEIGRVAAEVGAGGEPFHLDSGRLFLAGPIAGAPFSIAAVIPALAGPVDLGTVLVRLPVRFDPKDGHLALSGKLPLVQRGVRLRLQSLSMTVDRPGFISNPTQCDSAAVRGLVGGSGGSVMQVTSPFQLFDCGSLRFAPKLGVRFMGGEKATRHAAHPGLLMRLRSRAGESRMKRAVITLPGSAQLDPGHIRKLCKPAAFAGGHCPKGSAYGFATAESPLLTSPLKGPVYLRSSSRRGFPTIAAKLAGEIEIDVTGRIRFVDGRIRLEFSSFPDLPVKNLAVRMFGGSKGILVNNRDLCRAPTVASARLLAYGGRRAARRVPVAANCEEPPRHRAG